MSIDKKIQNYQHFFSDQVREAEMEQKSIIKAPMNLLFRKEEIIVGYVDHVNDNLGHVVLKFPKDKAPRLKVQKSVMVIKKDAKAELGPNVTLWTCSFLTDYHSITLKRVIVATIMLDVLDSARLCMIYSRNQPSRASLCL